MYATVEALAGDQTAADRSFAAVHASAANARRRVAPLGHEAFALATTGQPEAASDTLRRCVALALADSYGMGLRRALGVRAAFDPAWARLPAVRDLDGYLAMATTGEGDG